MNDLCPRTGWHLTRGHCLHYLRQLPTESVDSFVTDPPYGIDLKLQWNRARPLSIKGDRPGQAVKLWREFLPEAARVARPNSAHLFFGTWKSRWMPDLLAEHFTVKGCVIWFKNTWGLGWYLRPRWELIWYVHKGRPPLPEPAPPDVWEHARDHRLKHPCQKPVELMRRAVRFVCPAGGLVSDPFAGICSTGVAALLEGRAFTGSELAPRYARLGRHRLAEAEREAKAARDSRAARDSSHPLRNPFEAP